MSIALVLSTLLTASAVWGHPHLKHRATPQVYSACINANDIAITMTVFFPSFAHSASIFTPYLGPYIYLRSISDQFTAAGAKATFFMNGNNWDCIYNPDRISDVQYVYAAGHMIGSHTWSHVDLTTISTVQIQDGMFRMEEAFSRILGIKPAFMRPPFGNADSNLANIQAIAAARGQSIALWDWDTGDADGNTTAQSEALYDDVANAKVKNALILNHETEENTATVLVGYALNLFKSKGYNLVTMAQCLGVDPYQAIGLPPAAGRFLDLRRHAYGAAVEIADCVAGGSTGQSWTVAGAALQIFDNKCLDVTGGSAADGTKMQIWTCTGGNTNQAWSLTGSTIQWSAHSSCLDLTSGNVTNGNIMQIWTCTGGINQQWTRTTGPGTLPPPTPGHKINPGASSTTCLTAATNANGGTVTVAPCDGSAGQAWTQNGQTLVAYGTMCLDVTGGSTTNGVKMQIWSCTPGAGDAAQHFTVTADNRIQWTNMNKCLDLTGGSLASGNQIQMWDCSAGNTNQVWKIV
ncbi:hypothetical protein MVEN_00323800 [Mycena venus]|uniref:NodB homology domain-containing protein n=1 Tax=Mycena venus TaxID=2733690 RepID=A0A8H6YNU5_9AGAR|nr:hypothetical protein MVEN_00323800 [Mycena venus]